MCPHDLIHGIHRWQGLHRGDAVFSVSHLRRHTCQLTPLLEACCCSVTQLCPTLCDPMDCSMPGFPVLHYLLELAQTHVHWVDDAIQPSLPLSSPSPPAFSLSQNQGLFQWVGSSHQVVSIGDSASIPEMWPANYCLLYCPLLLLPSIFPSITNLGSTDIFKALAHCKYKQYIAPYSFSSSSVSYNRLYKYPFYSFFIAFVKLVPE